MHSKYAQRMFLWNSIASARTISLCLCAGNGSSLLSSKRLNAHGLLRGSVPCPQIETGRSQQRDHWKRHYGCGSDWGRPKIPLMKTIFPVPMEQPRFSPIPESFPPSWKKKDKQKERPVPFGPSYITYLTQLAPQVLCRLIRASFASRGKAARNSTETCQRGETENWDVNTGSWDVFPGLVHFCHTAAAGRRKKGRKWVG